MVLQTILAMAAIWNSLDFQIIGMASQTANDVWKMKTATLNNPNPKLWPSRVLTNLIFGNPDHGCLAVGLVNGHTEKGLWEVALVVAKDVDVVQAALWIDMGAVENLGIEVKKLDVVCQQQWIAKLTTRNIIAFVKLTCFLLLKTSFDRHWETWELSPSRVVTPS